MAVKTLTIDGKPVSAEENEMSLYLNGKQIATGPGTPDLTTDALDFFVGHAAVVDKLEVFDRLLSSDEVQHLYAGDNTVATRK